MYILINGLENNNTLASVL